MNNYAISSKGIGDALLHSASALAAGGNNLDESIGLITAMNEIIQDPDVVGTAVKTISLRLRNTSGQLQEMGEDAEGSFESITKLQQTIFKNSGVDIMLDSENFKSTTQILTELADAWQYMSDVQRASITKAVAGVHQANTFNAIMSNMSTAIEATNTAANSDGSALAENEKYLDSIGGKITKMKASFETFSTDFINGGFAKGIITGLTGILDVLTKIEHLFGASGILAGLFGFGIDRIIKNNDPEGSLFGTLKGIAKGTVSNTTAKNIDADIKALRDYKNILFDTTDGKVKTKSKLTNDELKTTQTLLKNMNFSRSKDIAVQLDGIAKRAKTSSEALREMHKVINDNKQSLYKTENLQTKFVSGLKSFGKSILQGVGIGLIIGLAFKAIEAGIENIQKQTISGKLEQAEEARNVYKQTLQEIEDIDNEILSNKSRIDELNAKGSLTLVEDAELIKLQQANQQLELQKKIKENIGTTQQREAAKLSMEAVTKGVVYGKGNVDGTKYGRKEYNDLENGGSNTIKSTIKAQKLLNEDSKNYNELLKEQLDLTELINNPNISKSEKFKAQNDLKQINKEIEKVSKSIENHQAFIGENIDTLFDNYASFLDEDGNVIAGYEDIAAQVMEAIRLGSESIDSLDFAENLTSSIEGVLSKENFAGLKDNLISAAKTGESELTSLIANTDGLQEALDIAGVSAEEFTSYIMGIANAGDSLGNVESQIKQIREALSSDVQGDFDSFIAGKTDEEINAFYNYIRDNQIDMSTWTMEDFEWQWNLHVNVDGIESVETLTSALENAQNNYANLATAMSESVSGTGLSSDSIGSVKAMFSELEGYDASILFEKTANGIHLNEEALESLNDQYEAKELERYEKSLENLNKKYNEASKMLQQMSENTEEYNAKKLELDNLKAQIEDTQMLQSRFMGLTSAYNKFVIATQSGNERDSYESIAGNYEAMQDLIERGWYGDDSLEAYLDLLLNVKKRTGDTYKDFQLLSKTIEGTSYSIKDFFQFDSDGNLTTDGLSNFMQAINDTLGKEYAWKEADGSWSFDFSGKKIEEIADLFNMNTEAIQLFERALIDAGAKVKLDPLTASLDDLNAKAEQSKETLTSMGEETTDIEVKTDFSNISDSEEKLSSIEEELTFAKGLYDEISASDIDPDIKTAKLEYLIDQINVLLNLRNELAQPTYMELNTEDVDEGVADYLTNIQAYQTARANRQKVEYTGTSEEIQAAVKEEEKALQPILDMTDEQLLEIDIDVRGMDDLERVQTIKDAINNDKVDFGITDNLDYMLNRAEQGFDKLKEMGELSAEYEIDFNLSEVSDAQEQIDRVSKDFDKYRNEDGSWNLSIDGAEEAQQILAYLILQKQDVERPSVLNVDTSQASEEVQNAQQVLSNFIEASNEYEIAVAMGVNVEESKNNFIESFKTLNSLTGEGKEYVESMGITLDVDISENPEEALGQAQEMKNTLLEKIKNLFGSSEGETVLAKYNVQATVDGSVNEGEVKTAKGEVTWTNKTDIVDGYSKKVQKAKGKVIWDNDETKVKHEFTANGTIKWSGGLGIFGNSNTGKPSKPSKPSKPGGSGGKKGNGTVDGTANTVGLVDGTAFARGSWGTKSSGLALGGELGRRIATIYSDIY